MTTEVVSAVIIRAGRILLTQRRADKDFAFAWESPGGKVDGNESHHDALRRELREEIGVEVPVIAMAPIWTGEFSGKVSRPDRARIVLHMYRVLIDEDAVPVPREGQGIGWFTAKQFCRLELAPANMRAAREILLSFGASEIVDRAWEQAR